MKWLGHSDIKITSEFYLHLEFNSKVNSANSLMVTYQSNDTAALFSHETDPIQSAEELKAQIYMLQQKVQVLESQLDVQVKDLQRPFETEKSCQQTG